MSTLNFINFGVVLAWERDLISGKVEVKCKLLTFLFRITQGNRDETNTVDMAKATKEAQDLFQVTQTFCRKWYTCSAIEDDRYKGILNSLILFT